MKITVKEGYGVKKSKMAIIAVNYVRLVFRFG